MKPFLHMLALILGGLAIFTASAFAQLDSSEQQAMVDTMQYALENNKTNQASDWVNPDAERSGAVKPIRTFENAQGQPCREFVTTIIIGDKEEQGYGTACRQPDGSWKLSDDATAPAPPAATSKIYIYEPPPHYYVYPSGFFGMDNIYLSFSYVFRSGDRHHGRVYLDGRSFRRRYPWRIRERVYVGPGIIRRYRLHNEWEYRNWERHQPHFKTRGRMKYRHNGYDKRHKRGWDD